MSIETWKEEFLRYYVRPSRLRMLKAAELKYVGALPENLKKHNVYAGSGMVLSEPGECFGRVSFAAGCTLCKRYQSYDDSHKCPRCPLQVRGLSCDNNSRDVSPWRKWTWRDDPKPMLRLIRRAIKKEQL